jgi:hypothetical protein
MPGKRAARPPWRRRALTGTVAAAVALLVLLAVGFASGMLGGSDDDPAADTASGTSTDAPTQEPTDRSSPSEEPTDVPSEQPTEGASSGSSAGPAAVRRCATAVNRAEKVVAAASDGVSHWHTHVQARTDMLKGAMSVAEMDRMWKRTRLAGPADQERFRAALDGYQPQKATCDLADGQGRSAAACATRFRTASTAVDAAEAAMADWKSHLDNMASYAAGGMTQVEAQTRWVAAWRNAPQNITAYDEARTALAGAPTCEATAG